MTLFLEGEKRAWNGGILGTTVHLSLHGGLAVASANELSVVANHAFLAANYIRLAVQSPRWTVDNQTGAATNADELRWPNPDAGRDWPNVFSVGVWDAAVNGQLIAGITVAGAPLVATSMDPISIAVGQLIWDV